MIQSGWKSLVADNRKAKNRQAEARFLTAAAGLEKLGVDWKKLYFDEPATGYRSSPYREVSIVKID